MGVGTSTPWRTLSVTGTVGLKGLTGSVGVGSVCLSATDELVYNSGTDACLSSLRSTKHDINNLQLSSLSTLNLLSPVSFVYNEGDGRVRYGFIAEDVSQIDQHLATYNAKGEISGVDDRAISALVIGSIKELYIKSNTLASTTVTLESSINKLKDDIDNTTSSSTKTLVEAILALDLRVQALALAISTTNTDFVSSTTLSLLTNQDFITTLSTSTANSLKTDSFFVQSIANAVKNIIAQTAEWVVAKISATLGVFESVESKNIISDLVKSNSVETNTVNSDSVKSKSINTQTASISNGLQINDKITGQIYCVSLKNGDWDKTLGQCSEISTTTEPVTEVIKQPVTTILPSPEPIITTLPTPTPENQIEETSTTTLIVNATTTEIISTSDLTPTTTQESIPVSETTEAEQLNAFETITTTETADEFSP